MPSSGPVAPARPATPRISASRIMMASERGALMVSSRFRGANDMAHHCVGASFAGSAPGVKAGGILSRRVHAAIGRKPPVADPIERDHAVVTSTHEECLCERERLLNNGFGGALDEPDIAGFRLVVNGAELVA